MRCLVEIALTIRARLVQCKSRSRFGFTRWISNHAGEITHNQNSMMSHILKLSHLPQNNCMTNMQIRTRWIASQFDDHWFVVLERIFNLLDNLIFRQYFCSTGFQDIHLFIECRKHAHHFFFLGKELPIGLRLFPPPAACACCCCASSCAMRMR